jgi:uncharacterized membrane protein/predicted DsbA family dithiol-disulfide isomerase
MAVLEIPYRPSLIRALALLALAVSAAMMVDGLFTEPHLCGFEDDCRAVASSWIARPFGVPLPLIGVVVFALLFGLSVAPGPRARRALVWLALLAGLGGLCLLAVQVVVIGRLCPFCVVVDGAALLLAGLVVSGTPAELPADNGSIGRRLWLACGGVVLCLAVVVGAWPGETGGEEAIVPPQISTHWIADKVNVVAVSDFECRFCRRLHPVLMDFVKEQGDRIHFVLLPVAAPAHPHARGAVKAHRCAEQQGKGPAMAELLMRSAYLSPDVLDDLAGVLKLDLSAYQGCLLDPALDKKLDDDVAWMKEAHPRGLPAVWVQNRKLEGLRPETARAAIQAAVRKVQRLEAATGD